MYCPYCGTPDGRPAEPVQTHFSRLDCEWCGARLLVSIDVQKPPDVTKLRRQRDIKKP